MSCFACSSGGTFVETFYADSTMTTLARQLRVVDYFTLGWGTMVGVGWLVVMDDWLLRGGVLGTVLGFAIGGALLLPVGYVYARLVKAMPDASGEVAYTANVFPQSISYVTGWMMVLSYFIVCPWEAVAVGKIAAYIFPVLDSVEVYRIAKQPVYLPHLLIGLGLTGLITLLNYHGVRLSATFQNWTTFGTLALFVVFVSVGVSKGSPHNFPPLFTHGGFVSVLLVLQIVLYFMTGYESVGKAAEEASPELREQGFLTAIWLAIVVGIVFYTSIIAAVAYVAPWKDLAGEKFMTAVAFEHAVGARWIVRVILAAALLSLFKCFNGNFVAASRLLFGIGRRGLIPGCIGEVHPRNQTPSLAVLLVGITTAACMFLGDAILVPVTEVGSVAAAVGILATCAAYYRIVKDIRERCVAVVGSAVGLLMILMKVLPAVPGHFNRYEWMALGVWVCLGVVLGRWPRS
jgi:APA family basic amino acid/polyamine antiporter